MKTQKHTAKQRIASAGLVTNTAGTAEAPATSPSVKHTEGFQHLTTNLKTKLIRNEKLDGKDYIVAPMVMIVNGVHSGSLGPLYYPAEELSKTPVTWNMKPVVITHPTEGSACLNVATIQKYSVGIIMNTAYDKKAGRLTAEAWFDSAKLKKVAGGSAVENALKTGKMLEVSTGLFTDNYEEKGEFDGEAYDTIARNYRPDHLAILPDAIGACSIAKGAGLIRNQAKTDNVLNRALTDAESEGAMQAGLDIVTANALSQSQISCACYDLIRAKLVPRESMDNPYYGPYPWVADIYDGYFIYSFGQQLFLQNYKQNDKTEVITLDGEPVQVRRTVQYKSVEDGTVVGNSNTQIQKEPTMNKKDIIASLIANHGWSIADQPSLEAMPDATLNRLLADGEKIKANGKAPEQAPAAKPVEAAPAANKQLTTEEWLASAPPAVANMVRNSLEGEKATKDKLVSDIVANKFNVIAKADLEAMTVPALNGIAKMLTAKAPANYGGAGIVAPTANADGTEVAEEPLGLPTTNKAKK